MKKLLVLLSILIINTTLYSENILVLPFTTYNADFFAIIQPVFALELNSRCKYNVLVLSEYEEKNSNDIVRLGVLDIDYIKRAASTNNARYVLMGSVSRFDLRITMSADLIDTATLSIVGSGYVESENIDTIINSVPYMVDKVLNYKGVATYLHELGEGAAGAEEITKLLKVYVNARNKSGETAIMIASYYGYANIVSKLIEEGADTEFQRLDGLNALMLAARKNNVNVVKVLLDNYADINTKTSNGFDVLSHAAYMGSYDVIKLLVEERYLSDSKAIEDEQKFKNSNLYNAMLLADSRGYTRIVQYIFEAIRIKTRQNG